MENLLATLYLRSSQLEVEFLHLKISYSSSDHYRLRDNLKIKATLNLGECFEG